MSHEVFEETIPLYAAGALERDERQALEAHLLTGCASCHAALKEVRAVAALLPYGLPPASPPPGLRAKILAKLAPPPQPAAPAGAPRKEPATRLEPGEWMRHVIPPAPTWRTHPAVAPLLLVLLIGTAVYALSVRLQAGMDADQRRQVELALHNEMARLAALQRQVREQETLLAGMRQEVDQRAGRMDDLKEALARQEGEIDALRQQLASREQETAGLRRALAQKDDLLGFLHSPRVKVVSLAGSAVAETAGAFVLFDPESRKAFLYGFNMPTLPPGKIYQLWAIMDKPVSAGTFGIDAGHKSRHMAKSIPDPARITKFAVSLEPEGGRPQPTGDIYLIGQL